MFLFKDYIKPMKLLNGKISRIMPQDTDQLGYFQKIRINDEDSNIEESQLL